MMELLVTNGLEISASAKLFVQELRV